jgi:CRP/FNR family transcriptional regulator
MYVSAQMRQRVRATNRDMLELQPALRTHYPPPTGMLPVLLEELRQPPQAEHTGSPAAGPTQQPAPRAWHHSLALVERHLSFLRRSLHAGDSIQTAGEPFRSLHLIRVGAVKSTLLSPHGNVQVAGLHIQGDWVGFDGLSTGVCACDAIAMDTSEVWTVRYLVLQKTAERVPELSFDLQAAMGRQMARERDWRLALATLPADARLADFLRNWAQSLALRELRTDHITLRLTRAEIGNYLGMTLETVSRSFSRLVELALISFDDKGRRHFAIPDVAALVAYVDSKVILPAPPTTRRQRH